MSFVDDDSEDLIATGEQLYALDPTSQNGGDQQEIITKCQIETDKGWFNSVGT